MDHMILDSYLAEQHLTFKINGEVIRVVSKPGIPDWDQLTPSTVLLATYPAIKPNDHILLIGCHHGALGAFLAHHLPNGQLSLMDNSSISLELTRLTLDANRGANIQESCLINIISNISMPEEELGSYDSVFIQIPKGRDFTRRWLFQAYLALHDGGTLYIAGSNKAGIHSAVRDAAQLFEFGNILGYKKGNRVIQLVKKTGNSPSPAWVSGPGIQPGTWIKIQAHFMNHNFIIHSLPGVFSSDHIDAGTAMLLQIIETNPSMRVLDAGCGYGIVGLYAAAKGAGWVDFVDSDLMAVASTRETLALNQVNNASVFLGDLLKPVSSNSYNLILSNPPFHSGHSVEYMIAASLIKQAYQSLCITGKLVLVANRFLPYDQLIKDVFGKVTHNAESGKFYVLSGLK